MSLTGKGRDRDRFRVYSNPNLVRLVKLFPQATSISCKLSVFNLTHAMAPFVIITVQPRVSTF